MVSISLIPDTSKSQQQYHWHLQPHHHHHRYHVPSIIVVFNLPIHLITRIINNARSRLPPVAPPPRASPTAPPPVHSGRFSISIFVHCCIFLRIFLVLLFVIFPSFGDFFFFLFYFLFASILPLFTHTPGCPRPPSRLNIRPRTSATAAHEETAANWSPDRPFMAPGPVPNRVSFQGTYKGNNITYFHSSYNLGRDQASQHNSKFQKVLINSDELRHRLFRSFHPVSHSCIT